MKAATLAHPVAIIDIQHAVDVANAWAVNVAADDTVCPLTPCLCRQCMLISVHDLGCKLGLRNTACIKRFSNPHPGQLPGTCQRAQMPTTCLFANTIREAFFHSAAGTAAQSQHSFCFFSARVSCTECGYLAVDVGSQGPVWQLEQTPHSLYKNVEVDKDVIE